VYRELTIDLPGCVLWTRTPEPAVARVVPDGCIDLIWSDGGLFVAGPDTVAHDARPELTYVGVRFHPGWAPVLLGVPAAELRDARVPLDDVWPAAEVRRLAAAVEVGPARGLTEAVRARLERTGPPDPLVRGVARALRAGQPVGDVAARAGLSARQLQRRSVAAFGYGPKTLARVLRFDRALALAHSGLPYARVATETGYADQAHLAREVRALAGVPLRELLAGTGWVSATQAGTGQASAA